jgi:hypothetical protein
MATYTVGEYDSKLQGRAVKWDSQPTILDIMDFLSKNQGGYEGFEVDTIVDEIHIAQTNTPFGGHLEVAVMLRKLCKTGLPWVIEIQ